jgi:hypothetical protein
MTAPPPPAKDVWIVWRDDVAEYVTDVPSRAETARQFLFADQTIGQYRLVKGPIDESIQEDK